MLAQDLLGTWHLRSAIGRDNGDNEFYPMGKDLSGHIVYTPDGYVSVNIMSNGRHRSHRMCCGWPSTMPKRVRRLADTWPTPATTSSTRSLGRCSTTWSSPWTPR